MNLSDLTPEAVMAKLAGVAGAIVSMRFLQGSWPERIFMAFCGAMISYFASPFLSSKSGLPEGLAGFLLGLFGMAVVSRMWEFIQTTPVADFWPLAMKRIKKWLGVE